MSSQRINKVLANHGICARRKVDLLIRDRKIMVNGSLAEIGMRVNPKTDKILINGKELINLNIKTQLILFNKPKNVITTFSDQHNRKTIIDFLPQQYKNGYFPIGRLDFLSRGALLIANDGEICYKLIHPKFEHKKIYIARLFGNLKEIDLESWRLGVNLESEKTNPCEVHLIKKDQFYFSLKITLKEGRNRQIRKIASLFGYKVVDLKRINFANIPLGNLQEGSWKLVENFKYKNVR